MNSTPVISIFVSSPGDVKEEREQARQVVAKLQSYYGDSIELRPLFWEDLPLQATTSFQKGIDGFLEENPVDIAIFILWSRLGSPVGDELLRADGSRYQSGTEREFELMLARLKETGGKRPYLAVYHRNDDKGFNKSLAGLSVAKIKESVDQRTLVDSFIRQRFYDQQGRNERVLRTYTDPAAFRKQLETHLREAINRMIGEAGQSAKQREQRVQRVRARMAHAALLIALPVIAVLTMGWYKGRDFGPLTLTTDPPGATITSGEQDFGQTPYAKLVQAGKWEFVIHKDGYLSLTTQVSVARSVGATQEFTLIRADGSGSGSGSAKFSAHDAHVVEVQGTVEIQPAGANTWVDCATNQMLHALDKIRVGKSSRAALRFQDNTIYELGELSELEILPEPRKSGPLVSFYRGILYFFGIEKEVEIRTPHATAGIRG